MSLCSSIHWQGLRNRLDRCPAFKSSVGRRDVLPTRVALSSKASDFNRLLCFSGLYISRDSMLKRQKIFGCYSFLPPRNSSGSSLVKIVIMALPGSFTSWQATPLTVKLAAAVTIITFALWGLGPLVRKGRSLFMHKNDSSWKKSDAYYFTTSYVQPLLLWVGATLVCRSLDPVILPYPASQVVKQRLLNFVQSLSTVLALAYCLSSMIQQMQKFLMDGNDPSDARNMGFQFAGKATYTAVWIAAISLFMELLGFSTQKWLTAGGLGTVLLTLAGREIFTNFLSSVMIHATRPFVVNEWIQTRIEGYEVSGTVELVGWWSPTIVRGEDREAVHIPNNKFTVNVVRNLSQKSHWRIKTHLAISHLDVSKINSIVADMRKVLAKNPQVEQQRLHRRVFLDNINHENQALLILVSCFVKTSHYEEYLCVKEAILLDLLRVISHHKARLATPIRTMQRMYRDNGVENVPFADARFSRGGVVSNRPLLLIEPSHKINGDDKMKNSTRASPEQGGKTSSRPTIDSKSDSKTESSQVSALKTKEKPKGDSTSDVKNESAKNMETNEEVTGASKSGATNGAMVNMKSVPKSGMKSAVVASSPESHQNASMSKEPGNKNSNNSHASKSGETNGAKANMKSVPKSGMKSVVVASSPESHQNASMSKEPGNKNSNNSHPKAVHFENGIQNAEPMASAVSISDTGPGKGTESPEAVRAKSDNNTSAQAPVSSSGLQENTVLGVALEGRKRTLPIEEVLSPNSPGRTDLA